MRWGIIPMFHKATIKTWKAATYDTHSDKIETGIWKNNAP